jgi:Flp pilus assembly protein TadG
VEFALILPILLMLLGGIIDFGRLYYQQIVLSNAARDGARLVSSNTSSGWTQATIQGRITSAAAPLTVTSTSKAGSATGPAQWYCSTSGASMFVTVSAPFSWTVLQFVPGLPVPSTQGKATMTCT